MSTMAAAFERDGVIIFPGLVGPEECDIILQFVEETICKGQATSDTDEILDFTDETRAAANRVHLALPLRGNHADAVSDLFGTLYPLLARILQCSEDKIPLLGSGFMRTSPRAKGQHLHKDVHHYDRHLPIDEMLESASNAREPRCLSIQLQLSDASAGAGGSLEVLPGSHRPDAPNGRTATIEKAVKDPLVRDNGVVPIDVPAGTVTIYSSRLWHRGGSNDSNNSRTFVFFTVTEPNCLAPPGLIHTMERRDVGEWGMSSDGLLRQKA